MLANFFGKSSPINFVIVVGIYLVYFFAHYFIGYDSISMTEIAVLIPLVFVVFLFYNFILYKNKLTLYNSYGFLFFVILFGVFSISNFDRNTILFHGLLLVFLRRVFSLRSDKNIFGKLFDSGFWLGIFFLFEPYSVMFGGLIYLSTIMFQKVNWQMLIIPLVGFFVPLFCSFTYYFWFDQSVIFWNYFDWNMMYDLSVFTESELLIPIYCIGPITLLAYILKTPKVIGISGSYRKYWTLITINLIVGLLFIFMLNNKSGAELQYLFFPISVILANWLETIKSRILKEIVLVVALILPFIMLIA